VTSIASQVKDVKEDDFLLKGPDHGDEFMAVKVR
jgi:hypothetical protein